VDRVPWELNEPDGIQILAGLAAEFGYRLTRGSFILPEDVSLLGWHPKYDRSFSAQMRGSVLILIVDDKHLLTEGRRYDIELCDPTSIDQVKKLFSGLY
jgi:hypothetical protein